MYLGGFTQQDVCQIKGGPPVEMTTTTKEGLRFGQMDAHMFSCVMSMCLRGVLTCVWICHLATHASTLTDFVGVCLLLGVHSSLVP